MGVAKLCTKGGGTQRTDGDVAAYLQAALTTEGIKEITQNCLTKWKEINSFVPVKVAAT